jgi:hypothetical protein
MHKVRRDVHVSLFDVETILVLYGPLHVFSRLSLLKHILVFSKRQNMKALNHPFRMQEYTISNCGILGKYQILFVPL